VGDIDHTSTRNLDNLNVWPTHILQIRGLEKKLVEYLQMTADLRVAIFVLNPSRKGVLLPKSYFDFLRLGLLDYDTRIQATGRAQIQLHIHRLSEIESI
jgi:hypothetical protein